MMIVVPAAGRKQHFENAEYEEPNVCNKLMAITSRKQTQLHQGLRRHRRLMASNHLRRCCLRSIRRRRMPRVSPPWAWGNDSYGNSRHLNPTFRSLLCILFR